MQESPMWSRAKHAALSVLIGRVPVGEILILSPDMIPNLLEHLQHPVVASHVRSLSSVQISISFCCFLCNLIYLLYF